MQFFSKLLISFLLFNIYLSANNNFQIIKDWYSSHSFKSFGENSFYLDYLNDYGGEGNFSVKENNLNWKKIKSDSNGYVNVNIDSGRQITYLYSIFKSDELQNLALTIGYTGGLQVWLNEDKIYSNRISRKPIPDEDMVAFHLKKGDNLILVKYEGNKSSSGFYFKLYRPERNIFVNESKTICPDFRINHEINRWGQIEILNAGFENVSSLEVKTVEDSLIISSYQSVYNINAGEVRKIPFIVSTKKKIQAQNPISIKLKIRSEDSEKIININPFIRNKDDYFVTTYRSKLDGSIQPYSILLPKTYNPKQVYPLVLLLHGAWVTSWAQNIISYDSKDWAVQVAVHGRGNNRYREIGEVDLNEVINDVKNNYKINEDKMYLAGHSMGGYGTWFQASRYPDRWTAISPQAGYANYFLYTKENEIPPFLNKLYEEWSPVLYSENLLHIPAYIVHGAKDDNVSVEHAREMQKKLDRLNYSFIYDENPEGGHWWGPRGKDYGVDVVDKPSIWEFLLKFKEKKKNPDKIIYKTNTLRYNRAYWITINELDSIYSTAKIKGEIQNNEINIQLNNIMQFTLTLTDNIIDINEPVKITIDSKVIYKDFIPDSGCITLNKVNKDNFEVFYNKDFTCLNKSIKSFISSELDSSGKAGKILIKTKEQKKNHETFGPVIDAFNTQFLFINGKNLDNKISKAIKKCAEAIAKSWEISSNGSVIIKSDENLEYEELYNNNLILFGNSENNKIIAKINQSLPIKFSGENIIANGEIFSGSGIGFVEIYPSPFNSQKYVVVYGGVDEASFRNISNYPLEKLPDYVVYNSESFISDQVQFISAGFFNKYWKLD